MNKPYCSHSHHHLPNSYYSQYYLGSGTSLMFSHWFSGNVSSGTVLSLKDGITANRLCSSTKRANRGLVQADGRETCKSSGSAPSALVQGGVVRCGLDVL